MIRSDIRITGPCEAGERTRVAGRLERSPAAGRGVEGEIKSRRVGEGIGGEGDEVGDIGRRNGCFLRHARTADQEHEHGGSPAAAASVPAA